MFVGAPLVGTLTEAAQEGLKNSSWAWPPLALESVAAISLEWADRFWSGAGVAVRSGLAEPMCAGFGVA